MIPKDASLTKQDQRPFKMMEMATFQNLSLLSFIKTVKK